VEGYTVCHYTVLLVLTSVSGFAVTGFSNERSDSIKGKKFFDKMNVNLHVKVHFLNM
jgi:hypothetical protein